VAEKLRVVVVDKYPIFRTGVVQALRRDKNIVVVGEGATAEEAEQCAGAKEPHILLLEAAVPGSLKAVQAIIHANRNVKVIFLASTEDQEHVTRALHAGVHGYIMKGVTGRELVKAVKAVSSGERYITPALAWHLITHPAPAVTRRESEIKPLLSIREQQVLDCTKKGLTNHEIASILGLAVGTIKYYKTLAFKKIGVRNRLEAIVVTNNSSEEGC
jgi:DNA-binding NarL/FixJ family response regulator